VAQAGKLASQQSRKLGVVFKRKEATVGFLRRILDSRAPASSLQDMSTKQMVELGRRIATTLYGYMKQLGTESFFDPATLVVLREGGQIFVCKNPPHNLPLKEHVLGFVAIKDLPVLDRCKQLIGDGSRFGAMILGIDLMSRSIVGTFLLQGHQVTG
jgi:hypothetical protein